MCSKFKKLVVLQGALKLYRKALAIISNTYSLREIYCCSRFSVTYHKQIWITHYSLYFINSRTSTIAHRFQISFQYCTSLHAFPKLVLVWFQFFLLLFGTTWLLFTWFSTLFWNYFLQFFNLEFTIAFIAEWFHFCSALNFIWHFIITKWWSMTMSDSA